MSKYDVIQSLDEIQRKLEDLYKELHENPNSPCSSLAQRNVFEAYSTEFGYITMEIRRRRRHHPRMVRAGGAHCALISMGCR